MDNEPQGPDEKLDLTLGRLLRLGVVVSGLVVLLHSDIDMPFAKVGAEPVYLSQMKALLARHPKATIIWAHAGLGRVINPVQAEASAAPAQRSPRGLLCGLGGRHSRSRFRRR